MSLQLKIISEHANLVGDDAEREFSDAGGTIGRSLQNDWILPDPDRYISGRHATIDFKAGMYYLLDTSSNGVYVNDEMEPIGRGNPRRLFDGDRLRMGDFQFSVDIDSGESLAMPREPKPTVVPDNIEQLVDEVSLRTGMKLLDEEEITGDDEFQSALFGNGPVSVEAETHTGIDYELTPQKPARSQDAPTTKNLNVTAEDLFDSFLDGLGISRAELHPSVNRPQMMLTAGQLLRQTIEGLSHLLASRSNLKKTFRLDQTTVLPRHNNPLKLSDNTNDLLKQLLIGTEGDYLGAEDSIREVCRDLINHQNAFLDAMNTAFIDFADRFDPDELQESFDRTMGANKILKFLNAQKYWQAYRDLYPIMTEKGTGRFPQMFAEEFVSAYERQVTEYQRQDMDGIAGGNADMVDQIDEPELLKTQKLENPQPSVAIRGEKDEPQAVISDSGSLEIDQNFIDELDNSLSEEISRDQLKA